jgi:hypothetical protein
MFQVSSKTVSRWAREDASMPVTRVGRSVRFESGALQAWLRAHGRRKVASSDPQVAVNGAERT